MTAISKRSKLNIHFHNPNTPRATADYIMKMFVEANKKKVEEILQREASQLHQGERKCHVS